MLHGSSADFAYGESEISHLGLETVLSQVVAVPRLATAAAVMECRLREKLEYPDVDSIIFLGEVVSFHIGDDLVRGGKIDTRELDRLHPQQVIEAVRAGKPVLVEKPFALDRTSADAAIAEAVKHDVLVAFAHNRRFLPAVAAMREQITADKIGRILHIEGNFSSNYGLRFKPGMWRADRSDTVAGGMTGMGIHQIDLMILFGGELARIHARGRRQMVDVEVDDNVSFVGDFKNGATCAFTTLITTSPMWRFRILGSKGWLEMLGENRLLSREGNSSVQETVFPIVSTERSELEAFANAVADRAAFPVSTADALHGVSVLEAVTISIERRDSTDLN